MWLDVAQFVKEVSVAGAAVTGAVVAVLGLNTWKRQLKGTRRTEARHRLMILIYRYVEQMQRIRSSFMQIPQEYIEEEKAKPSYSRGSPEDRASARVYQAWFNELSGIAVELRAARLEARVVFGESFEDLEDRLRRVTVQVSIGVRRHFDMTFERLDVTRIKEEQIEKWDAAMYDSSSPDAPDGIMTELNAIAADFEKRLRE
jgi:hypothetical protein